jgi:hypothetical protein
MFHFHGPQDFASSRKQPCWFSVWDELAAVPGNSCSIGGRPSLSPRVLDFDFFGNMPLDPAKLVPDVPFLDGAIVTQRGPNTFSCTVDRDGVIKLSFFGLPGIPRLVPPLISPDNGLQIASLLDLAGTKASVVQMRAEVKDYIDVDALLTNSPIDLPTALGAALAIYGMQFNPQSTLKALCYFDDGNLRLLPQPVRDRLVKAACAVDLDRLPMIAVSGRAAGHDPGRSR